MAESKSSATQFEGRMLSSVVPFVLLVGALMWAYWSSLTVIANRWAHDPQYSHGYIVPLFAAFLLWSRRESFPFGRVGPSLWGIPVLAAALGLRLVAALYYIEWVDFLTLIPAIWGLMLLCFGWPMLRWSSSAIAFL